MANEVLSAASSPINSSPVPNEENLCRNCEKKLKQPKVLDCLHVFCQECLQSTVDEIHNRTGTIPDMIECSVCSQGTRLSAKGIESLPSDDVMSDMLEVDLADDDPIVCTSCKAKEKAIARCSDCANFLCPHCVSAHQYMRCFEDHKVISFEDMQNGDGPKFLKPMFCRIHPSENVKYFCLSCQEVVCNDCIAEDHQQPEHFTEKISNVDTKFSDEINNLITESKNKIKLFEETSNNLENALTDMQMQRDNVKGLVQETFQSYKTALENRRDELLKDLEEIHAAQEMSIIEMCHNVGKKIEKIEDGSKFAERVMKNGNSYQILMLHKVIVNQMLYLFNNNPKPDLNRTIEFKTNDIVFTEAIRKTFGSIQLVNANDPKIENPISSLHSSFEHEGFSLPTGVLSPELPQVSTSEFSNMHAVTPVPITGGSHFNSLHMSSSDSSPMGVAITGAHNIPENSLSRSSHSPAMSDSGISVDAASTNSAPSAPLYHDMTKLGRGQLSLNEHIVSGLNITVNGLTTSGSRTETPVSQTDSTLANILSPTATTSPLPTTNLSNIDTLVGFLNQTPSTNMINNLGNLGSLSGLGNMGIMNSLTNINSTSTSGSISNTSSASSNNFPTNISPPYPPIRRSNKMSPMQIRCKFGQLGPGKGQFNSPHGFCLGLEEDIIVADTNNHRIQVFEKNGEFKYQFGIPGRDEGQLWYPRKVAVMRNTGKYVVCDRGNERSRMQIFTKNGHFIRKIAIRYIDIVAGLAITQQGHIVAVDSVSPTVFCIAETGDLIKWFDCSDYMREPSDIAISGKEYFVCDFKGHCVVVFNEEGQFLRRIGCESITNYPNGIDISDAGDVLVGDSHGNRFHVAVFQSDGSLIGEFECPYVKVSRCCGLNITSEGYIVTLAKNNHHVLVLDTLYIT
ncbi:brain tumor protein-like [Octopus vulgaris]|uniref:Brain tumor protein-like n=1 Tax=Octopus vulgaris TaxID=6645 RepID=A0AA36BHR9_OCTVU|nr:brain tumor protein-like [Octopus vulgaris]